MDSLLTQASVAVELFGFGYFASSFVIYAHRRLQQPARWQPSSRVVSQTPVVQESTKPPVRVTVEQLRKECQKAGIKWRNAHGKNKHLKKDEMIAALRQLEQSKRQAPPAKPVAKPVKPPVPTDTASVTTKKDKKVA